jgi:hypothetical protein
MGRAGGHPAPRIWEVPWDGKAECRAAAGAAACNIDTDLGHPVAARCLPGMRAKVTEPSNR